MTAVYLSLKSANVKVGPVPVSTTSADTCPDACPLKASGCYAETGPLGAIWRALSAVQPGGQFANGRNKLTALSWSGFIAAIANLPAGQFWRHNQAGDLPGKADAIDVAALRELVEANKGKRGFTYTHKPLTEANASAIRDANARGFTVNLSANNLSEADTLTETGIGPVVSVLPGDTGRKVNKGQWAETLEQYKARQSVPLATPKGRTVSICPATYLDNVSCQLCQLCQRQTRKAIVGFPAHGTSKRKADAVARA